MTTYLIIVKIWKIELIRIGNDATLGHIFEYEYKIVCDVANRQWYH